MVDNRTDSIENILEDVRVYVRLDLLKDVRDLGVLLCEGVVQLRDKRELPFVNTENWLFKSGEILEDLAE